MTVYVVYIEGEGPDSVWTTEAKAKRAARSLWGESGWEDYVTIESFEVGA